MQTNGGVKTVKEVLEEFRSYFISTARAAQRTAGFYRTDIAMILHDGGYDDRTEIDGGNYGELATSLQNGLGALKSKSLYSPSTLNRKKAAVNAFLQYMKASGHIERAEHLGKFAPYTSDVPLYTITEGDFEKLVDSIGDGMSYVGPRDRALLRLMADTGITSSEAACVEYGDFIFTGKGALLQVDGSRALDLSDSAEEDMDAYENAYKEETGRGVPKSPGGRYFRNRFGGGLSERQISRVFHSRLKGAGLPDRNPHALRYMYFQRLLREDIGLPVIAARMGIGLSRAGVLLKQLNHESIGE